MDTITCITKNKCRIFRITEGQRKELEGIIKLVKSEDLESKLLGCSLFKDLFPENAYFDVSNSSQYNPNLVSIKNVQIFYFNVSILGSFTVGDDSLISILNNLLISNVYWIPKYL